MSGLIAYWLIGMVKHITSLFSFCTTWGLSLPRAFTTLSNATLIPLGFPTPYLSQAAPPQPTWLKAKAPPQGLYYPILHNPYPHNEGAKLSRIREQYRTFWSNILWKYWRSSLHAVPQGFVVHPKPFLLQLSKWLFFLAKYLKSWWKQQRILFLFYIQKEDANYNVKQIKMIKLNDYIVQRTDY